MIHLPFTIQTSIFPVNPYQEMWESTSPGQQEIAVAMIRAVDIMGTNAHPGQKGREKNAHQLQTALAHADI